jgi:hypothetical protein
MLVFIETFRFSYFKRFNSREVENAVTSTVNLAASVSSNAGRPYAAENDSVVRWAYVRRRYTIQSPGISCFFQ